MPARAARRESDSSRVLWQGPVLAGGGVVWAEIRRQGVTTIWVRNLRGGPPRLLARLPFVDAVARP